MNEMGKPELLAPAGDLEKLKTAILYGADAVYIGGEKYGLRAKAKNFTPAQMAEGIRFAHERGRRVYIALNIFAHNEDMDGFEDDIKELAAMGADAFIVSDPGFFQTIRAVLPEMELHISTQANITNYHSAKFWYAQGARRVVLARELSMAEITEIREKLPADMTLECFIHGAMCLSYSGRCYLSQYINERDANRGSCSQPCRWGYALMEEKREGAYYPVYEDERGSYILNSKDMRMIEHIPEIVAAGIGSLKIEGRMKTAYYVASTVKAYRAALDDYFASSELYRQNLPKYLAETEKTSHRSYYTGFYFDNNRGTESAGQSYGTSNYIRGYDYKAVVLSYDEQTSLATVAQRNKFTVGQELEVLTRTGEGFSFTLEELFAEDGTAIESAPHPEQIVRIRIPKKVQEYDMLRHAQS